MMVMLAIILQILGMCLFAKSTWEETPRRGVPLMVAAIIVYTIGAMLIFKAGAPP
ncbi:putative membrane protein [Peteryoungia aggregata LMG 23059]|uniref:Membrane protein n=1 Tax=Peteryoungia aggregata LMG 23059 TaxID=1368425 RepID=A0ABU0GAP2_9HYPH|nr:hypothetical protein [Peteryoungia aggregata]MDQ0422368.1 putative membrane protein [Peteryoungia aggregata LMG 23059]